MTNCKSCGSSNTDISDQIIDELSDASHIYPVCISVYDLPIKARWLHCRDCGSKLVLPREIKSERSS